MVHIIRGKSGIMIHIKDWQLGGHPSKNVRK